MHAPSCCEIKNKRKVVTDGESEGDQSFLIYL